MIVGLVPGAMKPYHAGHHYLVSKAILECDHVIIFTSTKDRKGISGENMMKAWEELIKPNIPAEVRFVKSPVRSVWEFLNEESENENVYRIYGGTEEIARFSSTNLSRWAEGVNVINVAEKEASQYLRGAGPSPMAKGEWVRTAIENQDFIAFKDYLPGFLKPVAQRYLEILVS